VNTHHAQYDDTPQIDEIIKAAMVTDIIVGVKTSKRYK